MYTGADPDAVLKMDYFDAYLRYWEQYNYYVATTGLSANKAIRVVAYGKERMEQLVKSFYYRFGDTDPQPEPFEVFDKRDRHPEWIARAEPVVRRVSEVWSTVGLVFPLEEVMEGW